MKPLRASTLIASLLAVILSGTVFFRIAEGWSWLDAYFFTVVTISTVGYGNLVPVTVAGKLGTTAYIFVGLGIFAVAIREFAQYTMRKREEHSEWLIARLHPHGQTDEADAANADNEPAVSGKTGS